MRVTYYTIDLGRQFETSRIFLELRKANLKTTQIFYYAKSVDLSYAEYWINKGGWLIFLN